MVHIANSSQQITHAALAPSSVHSRVTGFQMFVPAGVGSRSLGVTSQLGQNLRLLRIDLWISNVTVDTLIGGSIIIRKGNTKPKLAENIIDTWEPIMQHDKSPNVINWFGTRNDHLYWTMNKLYTGEGIRFACMLINSSVLQSWWSYMTFQISEG